jgi:4-diphosphocytidyl-2-C-methyl-D-erythritol kinase
VTSGFILYSARSVKTSESIRLRAPAKINLSFRILNKRADGFHEIETLMAPVSLFDEITISKTEAAEGIKFTCDDASLSLGEDNLVIRAARLFLSSTGSSSGLAINLKKRIPHGAGLGGGSSDAASVLLGLNGLLQTNLPTASLAQLSAQLGSDVPFFVYRSAALCSGRGEKVRATSLPQQLRLLLLKPSFGVPTPSAYATWEKSRELPGATYAPQQLGGNVFVNDLERPVFEKYVFLVRTKTWLRDQPEVGAALLSGSGSTLFAVLKDGADGHALADRAKLELDPTLWTCQCETLAAA